MERMEDLNATGRMHKVTMTNRRTCTVNGVNDVLSFDLREILFGDGTGDADDPWQRAPCEPPDIRQGGSGY